MPNKFFPVSIDLNNKNILVIGAGKIALRKVKTLLDYNCNITIITKEISEEEFLELEKENKIKRSWLPTKNKTRNWLVVLF